MWRTLAHVPSQVARKHPGSVMNREDVNLIIAYKAVDDSIRPHDEFSDVSMSDFGNFTP